MQKKVTLIFINGKVHFGCNGGKTEKKNQANHAYTRYNDKSIKLMEIHLQPESFHGPLIGAGYYPFVMECSRNYFFFLCKGKTPIKLK